jgi:hypothetical protein
LGLFQLFVAHVVSHVSIVQQITESHPLGRVHRLRFYAGPDYFPEIRISGKRVAFVLPWHCSLLAFTYKETPEEYFLTTCLTVKEINSLEKCHPVQAPTPHYGPDFVRPRVPYAICRNQWLRRRRLKSP